jgi:hypothetical protein
MENNYSNLTLQEFLYLITRRRRSPILSVDYEMYQYLRMITNDFEAEMTKYVIGSIYEFYYRTIKIVYEIKKWDMPTKKDVCSCIDSVYYNQEVKIYNYEEAENRIMSITDVHERISVFRCLYLSRLIKFLKSKLPYDTPINKHQYSPINLLKDKITKKQATVIHSKLFKEKLIQPDIDSFLFWFGVADNQDNVKWLVWNGGKSLLAYFVLCICEKYKLKHGENRIIKPFETMFKISGISRTINDIKKTATPPAEFKKINVIVNIENKKIMDILLNSSS